MIFAHFVVKTSNKILTCKFKGSVYNADIESNGEKQMNNPHIIVETGYSVRFSYNGKRVSGIIDAVKTVGEDKRITPENRGKTLIVVALDDDADDRPHGAYRSYYVHRIEKL